MSTEPSAPSAGRGRVIAAVAVCVLALAGIAIGARLAADSTDEADAPLPVSVVYQPGSTTAACQELDAALPEDLGGLTRRTLMADEPGVAAWGVNPAIYRCGTETPIALDCSAALISINGVSWFEATDAGYTSYFAVDRSVRIALTVPDGTGTGPIQALSDVIHDTLPAREPCRDGQLVDTDTAD